MTDKKKRKADRLRGWRPLSILIVVLVLMGAGMVYALDMKRNRDGAPKVLNQPTEARQVKPFTEKPDKRFAPLPLEQEKHER